MRPMRSVLGILTILALFSIAEASTAARAYKAMGIEVGDVLSGTALTSKVLPGGDKQVVCLVTYLTGKRDEASAVNVRLGVFRQSGQSLESAYSRDFGAENGGYVARGDLQLIDLDRDGANEIVVCYDSFREPLIDQRICEVVLRDDRGFRTAWSGPVEYDATRAARDVPRERRDRFRREFDWANTLRTHGVTLFMDKKVIAVAGERLEEPRLIEETFPLRRRPDDVP